MIGSKREYVDYLRDILNAIDKAQQFTKEMNFLTFQANSDERRVKTSGWKGIDSRKGLV